MRKNEKGTITLGGAEESPAAEAKPLPLREHFVREMKFAMEAAETEVRWIEDLLREARQNYAQSYSPGNLEAACGRFTAARERAYRASIAIQIIDAGARQTQAQLAELGRSLDRLASVGQKEKGR